MNFEDKKMFNLPEQCKIGKKVPMKEYLSMEFKPAIRKKIKEQVKAFLLMEQIGGNLIPSFSDDSYNVQGILFLDIYVHDVKKALFMAELYQDLFKNPCVLRIYDDDNECYSFALKRLNLNDKTKIVVTDKILTPIVLYRVAYDGDERYHEALNFQNIKANQNLHTFYCELFLRAYFLLHEDKYRSLADWDTLWYSQGKTLEVFALMKKLVELHAQKKKTKGLGEISKINMEIKKVHGEIESLK